MASLVCLSAASKRILPQLAQNIEHTDSEIILLVSGFIRDAQQRLNQKLSWDIFCLVARYYNHYAFGLDSGEYTWTIDGATLLAMKQCANMAKFNSPTFQIAGLSWRIEVRPNGNKPSNVGSFKVFVRSVSMPDHWQLLECCAQISCPETKSGWTVYRQYDKAHSIWGVPDRWMLFSDIQTLDCLAFTVNLYVHRIVVDKNEVLYERPLTAKDRQIRWEVDSEMVENLKAAHLKKRYISPLYGGMYCLALRRNAAHFGLSLDLCALPKGRRKVDLSWTMEVVATGHDDFEQQSRCSMRKELTMEGLGTKGHGNGQFLAVHDLQRSNKLVFNVNITVNQPINGAGGRDVDHPAVEHWNQVAGRQQKDEDSQSGSALDSDRVDTLQSMVDSNISAVNELASKMDTMFSAMTSRMEQFETKLNRINKQTMAIQEQSTMAMESRLDEMQHRITAIDLKLKEVQKRTDGQMRRHSESNLSQSVQILAQIATMKEEMAAMKEAQRNMEADEEVKVEAEEERVRDRMENEVKKYVD